ncbi:hydrolase [beta proteobacterium AAP51]|nr:hydrolase [beta proteobacterium AAP51]
METTLEWLPAQGRPEQLLLLLHGFGATGAEMAPLAQALRSAFPQAAVLAPDAPQPSPRVPVFGTADDSLAPARQWYDVAGLTPQNWPGRVHDTLPALKTWVQAQQQRLGVDPAATALAGFSQGAVLALALALQHDGLAGRVLAFGGCLTRVPEAAPQHTTLHLFHGADDDVIPADGSRQALAQLAALQGDATLDIARGVGHGLHPALIQCALQRLQTHIPARTWRAALGAAPSAAPGAAQDVAGPH